MCFHHLLFLASLYTHSKDAKVGNELQALVAVTNTEEQIAKQENSSKETEDQETKI